MTRALRAIFIATCLLGLLMPSPSRAAVKEYEWALPEWRATWAAPRLADNRGFAVKATADAVYVAGVTGSHGTGAGDLFLLRYDHAGSLVWERTWGGFELDQAQGVAVDAGGIWVAGSHTTDAGRTEAALLRFSSSGDLLLERMWSLGIADIAQAVAVTPDAIYVVGLTQPTHSERDLFAQRLTLDGDVVWTRVIDGDGWDEAWDVATDGTGVFVAGYIGAGSTSQALLMKLDPADGSTQSETTWGDVGNDEARAITLTADDVYVTGGAQAGRSTDVFIARFAKVSLSQTWLQTTGGKVVGGGGYGIAIGDRGIYVAGGSYDFPAGGDAAILRFSATGSLEWSQIMGLPGFWDWTFGVDTLDGRFYVTGVLWEPGLEWYRVMTLAYDENFPTATLTRVGNWLTGGETARASSAMDSFSAGDFLRWAEAAQASDPGGSYVYWEGASDGGRSYGHGWVDTAQDPVAGEENSAQSITDISKDFQSGNYALVRDYTGVRGSLFDGLIRFRYYISHDRLIPQGGYLYIGETGIGLPPPPV